MKDLNYENDPAPISEPPPTMLSWTISSTKTGRHFRTEFSFVEGMFPREPFEIDSMPGDQSRNQSLKLNYLAAHSTAVFRRSRKLHEGAIRTEDSLHFAHLR
mmetsp:Transcript_16694/g.24192  ORF Transcript_16694/g.24192 Transcript_16694/m.24192 type:complete len:102 (-) Transcript_16694:1472-1777(-)